MDEYMREMVDLKTLVTKTLEKKGVLARIRAELRANVFQAMEEQDHEAESNGSSTFSLLGTCNERAKKLHASHSGKLLMGLVCDYMEWCELEHTMKVYLPELNQPRSFNRAELEDILGMKGESKDNKESRPLLLALVESALKDEKKASSGAGLSQQIKPARHVSAGGSRQISSPPSSGVVDPSETLEARITQANKKVSEKPIGGFHANPFQSRPEADLLGGAEDGTTSPRLSDESQKVYEKSSTRGQAVLSDLPPHRRSSGLPAFSGISRVPPYTRGNSNGSANEQQPAVPGEAGGGYTRASRDTNKDDNQKRREYSWREEDELQDGNLLSKKKETAWRDEDYDNPYMNSTPPNTQTFTEKGDGKVQLGEQTTSQTRRGSSMDSTGKALGNLHLEDDSASDPGSRQSSGSRGTPPGQSWQPAPRESNATTASAGNKKQTSAYFYSDSEEETAPEVPDEMRFEF